MPQQKCSHALVPEALLSRRLKSNRLLSEVKTNITQIKGVRHVMAGPQVNHNTAFQYGISMDFDDKAALKPGVRMRPNVICITNTLIS